MAMGKIYRATKGRPLNKKQKKQVYNIVNKNKLFRRSRQTLSTPIGTTGQMIELTECTEGDDRNNRLGDEITVFKIRVQMGANVNIDVIGGDAAPPIPESMQIRLIIAMSQIGAITVADFPSNTLVLPDYDKLVVYYDRTFRKSAFDGSVNIDFKKKFRKGNIPGITVKYDDDTSATDAVHHPIYAFVISSDNTYPPGVTLLGEMHFYDKN